MKFRSRYAAVGIAALAVAGATFVGTTGWRATRALRVAEADTEAEHQFDYKLAELRPIATGVEQISAPSIFHDAIVFKGKLYAAGPGGLFSDDKQYRAGELLPPAPITATAIGFTSLNAEPELWAGTGGEGIISFDGRTFRHLRPNDPRYRSITSALPLKVGRILFGTEKAGVLSFDGKTLSDFHESLRNMHVTALAGDDTDLWVGTLDRGLLHWRAGQVTAISNLPDKHVLSIATGSEGMVLVGTALGVAVVRGDKLERVVGDGVFARTVAFHKGRLYIGTLDTGIYEVPLQAGKHHFLDTPARAERFLVYGDYLLAASTEGVYQVQGWAPVLKPAAAVLADRNISALSTDAAGNLWVGYFDRGLDILDPSFTRARHFEDQHLFCVNRIVHGQTTAVATANGLVLFDGSGQKRQVLGRDQGLIANHVSDVVFQDGEMVAATPAGLSFIGSEGVRSLYAFHGLVNNHAYALTVANGKLYAGTLGGLSLLDGANVRVSYTTSNSPMRHNWVTAMASSGSDVFVGTYGAGVIRMGADGTWQTFSEMPANTEINPGALVADGTHVYAGTLGKGLLVYDGHRWNTMTQGLPSLNVTALHIANGRVFAGTDNGLVRLP